MARAHEQFLEVPFERLGAVARSVIAKDALSARFLRPDEGDLR